MSCQLHIPAVLPSGMLWIGDLLSPEITFVNLAEVINLVPADMQNINPIQIWTLYKNISYSFPEEGADTLGSFCTKRTKQIL